MGAKTDTSMFNPPASAGERELAQWLFEASLVAYNGSANSEIKRIARERPEAVLDALLFLAFNPGLVDFPSKAAVAEARRQNVYISQRDTQDNYIQVEYRLPNFTSTRMDRLREVAQGVFQELLNLDLPWDAPRVERLLKITLKEQYFGTYGTDPYPFIRAAEHACEGTGGHATSGMVAGLSHIREKVDQGRPSREERELIDRISVLLDDVPEWRIDARDGWGKAVLDDSQAMTQDEIVAWQALIAQAETGKNSQPTKAWQKEATPLLKDVGHAAFSDRLARWADALAAHRSNGKPADLRPINADVLRGLAWLAGMIGQGDSLPRTLQTLAEAAYAKVPGIGRRAPLAGNGAVWALMQWPAKVSAGRLRAIVDNCKNRQTTAYIEPRLVKFAKKAGTSTEALEEASLPDLGFVAGRREVTLGEQTVELIAGEPHAADVAIRYRNAKGKPVKTAPAALKRDHADALKRLKADAKDAARLLAATKRRLESAPLDGRSWTVADFKANLLDHGLAGTIVRRLIWIVDDTPVLFDEAGKASSVVGKAVKLGGDGRVRPWHPIGQSVEEVVAWRDRLAELGITQPFKQAHREVYVLTDAERTTETYSNRFAAHLIRQTQFRALADQRGWRTDYIGAWDGSGDVPPTLKLPRHNLRAEFWVDYAQLGTNEVGPSGGAMYLATDQVRFYEGAEREPMRLDRVPPLVLSEVLRDVDLFVGVSSVGNDPTWLDRGEGDAHADYWHGYSFGDLGETAKTRKAVLEKLVPRLKIADRCSFDDKFLVVRGDLRTYQIHLGSGNILMRPNDQYLCIVPARSADATKDAYLPFEGDRTLSVIVSKALLLADDTKITDRTILSQIGA